MPQRTRAGKPALPPPSDNQASQRIDQRIRDLGGWRGDTLAHMRALIRQACPDATEEWKWENPVWSRDGILCTGEAYAKVVKLTFARGASLPDPARLFNASLTGGTRRAIDIHEGERIDPDAFRALVRAAADHNGAPAPVLLSGGNPKIAKAEGDAPVRAYIDAMPGWKRELGRILDDLITRNVPGVRKAVKWNSPFYGLDGRGWFLSFHVFTNYVKVTFFHGASLRPLPPGGTPRSKDARWIDIRDAGIDEPLLADWVRQAAALPGWDPAGKRDPTEIQ